MRKAWSLVLLIGVLAWASGCSTPLGSSVTTVDQQVTAEVLNRLREDGVTRQYNFGVDAKNGAVTIYGNVPDEGTRRRALAVVQGTPGVESVHDQLMR